MFTRKKKRQPIIKDFEQFLKAYNCTYTTEKEDSGTYIFFKFQGGNFIASFLGSNDFVEITFPCIASAPVDKMNYVRSKCNDINHKNALFKVYYTIDHEENNIDISISFFNNRVTPDEMVNELTAAFEIQRQWNSDFADASKSGNENNSSDLESDIYQQRRELFLLRQMELREQPVGNIQIASDPNALTLWQMLETIAPLSSAKLLFMNVNTVDGQQRIDHESAMRNFDLRRALTRGYGKEAHLVRDYALIDLHYIQGMDQKPRMLSVALTAEGEDEHAIYTRVTITRAPRNVGRNYSITNEEHQAPLSTSMLIALDRTDDKQHHQEFDYMWTEAQQKIRDNEVNSMTEDQKLLGQVTYADVAYCLYWGQKMFYSGRYYEATLYFENMINSYRKNFFDLDTDQKRTFLETAYMLGFCYNELGLPKQAFYYLDLLSDDGNIRHTMELVNAMANSKDLRVFNYTEKVMDEVKRNFSEADELPDHIKDFINFLRRRRGYAYVDFEQLDQAEKIFTQMLDEEENADYAINELAYIKKLRQQRGEDVTADAGNASDDGNDQAQGK